MSVGRVRRHGRVTVPQEVRQATGITPGTNLLFVPLGPGRFEARALPAPPSIAEVIRAFSMTGPAPDLEALRADLGRSLAAHYLPDGAGQDERDGA